MGRIHTALKCADHERGRVVEFVQDFDNKTITITLTGRDNIMLGKAVLSPQQWRTVRSLFK